MKNKKVEEEGGGNRLSIFEDSSSWWRWVYIFFQTIVHCFLTSSGTYSLLSQGFYFPLKQIYYSQTNVIFFYCLLSPAHCGNKQYYRTTRVMGSYSACFQDMLVIPWYPWYHGLTSAFCTIKALATNAFMLNETSKKATEKSFSDTVTFGQSKFWKQALRDCSLRAHISLGEQCFHPLNPTQNM